MKFNFDDENMVISCDNSNDWDELKSELGIKAQDQDAQADEKPPAQVSLLAFEAAGAQYERTIERLSILMVAESAIFVALALFKKRRNQLKK